VRIGPAARIRGALRPPPDKSISHRALLLAAMSEGRVRLENVLRAADVDSTLAAVQVLGAKVASREARGAGVDLELTGAGLRGVREPEGSIDVGNAGTLLRLLPGWLAGQARGSWTLDGDESIRRRPVDRIAEPLRRMGATVECREGRLPPLVVGGSKLTGIRFELPVASAQVKSCVLLAGLLARGETTVVERLPSRDHTELMLETAGVPVQRAGGAVSVGPIERLRLDEVTVPGDFSSAAFMVAAATLVPGSELRIEGVGVNPTRTGLLDVLERMGAAVELTERRTLGAEPVADLVQRHAELRGTTVSGDEVPLLIDELPLVALLGAFADGATVVEGAQELRHKESDRIATVVHGLSALGARIEARPDGFAVEGGGSLRGGAIEAAGDHRLAMLGAVAGLASQTGVELLGAETAAVSYPGFFDDLASVTRRG
jgi:3-phosphoshikimate 1-carboxyvinyltransferase